MKIEVRRGTQQSSDDAWTAWRYYSADCSLDFPDVIEREYPSDDPTSVICERKYYAGDTATRSGFGYGVQQVVLSRSRDLSVLVGGIRTL